VWAVARRPRWILALLLALAIAGGFAALGQWQLARAIEAGAVSAQDFDAAVPLQSVATPNAPLTTDAVGQMVSADVTWVEDDLTVLTDRLQDGKRVSWIVGHAIIDGGPSLAVALGWFDQLGGVAAGGLPEHIEGRYLPSDSPQESDFEAGVQSALSVAQLINQWSVPPDGVYGGYVVLDHEALGLGIIDAPPPIKEVSLNLLNLFYAVEWVIFGGFAIFLWWRLVRDEWLKEQSASGQ
jgi:surfeit locus 1 family protein